MDPNYTPPDIETRQVYGISMQQKRNDAVIDASLFKNTVTKNKEVSLQTIGKLKKRNLKKRN
jgi:phosphoribosylaminoimidazolecarboxamide formyltransferase/IMP cyclohydrolase